MLKKTLLSISVMTALGIAHAEVVTDGTVGPALSLDGPDFNVSADLGEQVGSNLFHSFTTFNLNTDESATFSGPDNISNVISRVTGGAASSIDGVIRSTIPDADFYLLNPAGVMFGSNSALDVQGSFHVGAADSLRFDDGNEFSASAPDASSFSMAQPAAFGFSATSQGAINIVGGQALAVPAQETISLFGRSVNIERKSIQVAGGRINVAAIEGEGEISMTADGLDLEGQAGDINFDGASIVIASAPFQSGGNIFIIGDDINLNASIAEVSTSNAPVAINIQATNVTLDDFSSIATNSNGNNADAGSQVNINATDTITVTGETFRNPGAGFPGGFVSSSISSQGINGGEGGTLNLTARHLEVSGGAQLRADTFGGGNGGDINLNVSDSISVNGENSSGGTSAILLNSSVFRTSGQEGDAGNLNIETGDFSLQDGAVILANTSGSGQGGSVNVQANSVALSGESSGQLGSLILANTLSVAENAGDSGSINIQTDQLTLQDGAQIAAATFGQGNGGEIRVNASDSVHISGRTSDGIFGSGLFASTQLNPTVPQGTVLSGNAGSIQVNTSNLVLQNSGAIESGSVTAGDGGNIAVQAQTISFSDNSRITAATTDTGKAGNINISVAENIKLQSGSSISTSTESAGGGSIFIRSPFLVQLTDSSITTTVRAEDGDSGNITTEQEFIIMERSTIEANAFEGMGGNIDITVTGIFNFSGEPIDRVITASSQFGVDGIVEINSPSTDAIEGLVTLPAAFNAAALTQAECAVGKNAMNLSRYVQVDYAGAASMPGDWQIGLLPAAGFTQVAANELLPSPFGLTSVAAYPAMMANCSHAAM